MLNAYLILYILSAIQVKKNIIQSFIISIWFCVCSILNESFLRWHFQHIVHFQSWIAIFLSAWTISASCGALIAGHHQEGTQKNTAKQQQPNHNWYDDNCDFGGCESFTYNGGL